MAEEEGVASILMSSSSSSVVVRDGGEKEEKMRDKICGNMGSVFYTISIVQRFPGVWASFSGSGLKGFSLLSGK